MPDGKRIMEAAPMRTRSSRVLMGIYGTCHLMIGIGTMQVNYVPWPPVWAGFFYLAAALTWLCGWRFTKRHAVYAGAATVVAYAMRGGILALAYFSNSQDRLIGPGSPGFDVAQLFLSSTIWATFVILWSAIFYFGTVPLASLHERRQR